MSVHKFRTDIFLSITVAHLFLHNLGLLGFLSSKIGFTGFRKKYPLSPTPQPSGRPAYCQAVSNPALSSSIKPAKNNSGKLLVHNFSKVAQKLFNVSKKHKIQLFLDIKTPSAVAIEPLYDMPYFIDWLKTIAALYQNNQYFNLITNSSFAKRYIKDPIVNESYSNFSYFFNTKNIELYAYLIRKNKLFNLSCLDMLESLISNHYGAQLDKETLRHELLIDLFHKCDKSAMLDTMRQEDKNRLFSYWLIDYVFKIENFNEPLAAVAGFNEVVKKLEKIGFLKNISPDIYEKILPSTSSKDFFLKPPVYQNPKFLDNLNLNSSIDKFENKTFLFNLVAIYKDYCENQLYYSFGSEAEKTVAILRQVAEEQYLSQKVLLVMPPTQAKKVHKI